MRVIFGHRQPGYSSPMGSVGPAVARLFPKESNVALAAMATGSYCSSVWYTLPYTRCSLCETWLLP
jgi:hypothetical protein